MDLRNLFSKLTTVAFETVDSIESTLPWRNRPSHRGLQLEKLGFIPPGDAPYESQLYFPSILRNDGSVPVTVVQFQLDFGTALNRRLVQSGKRHGDLFRCRHSVPGRRSRFPADKCAPLTFTPDGTPVPVHLSCAVRYFKRNDGALRESLIAHVRRGRFQLVAHLQDGLSLRFSGKGVEIA